MPYEAWVGFEPGFIELENRLSLQRDNCCCMRAITQAVESPDRAVLTPGGSYRCDDVHAFIEHLPPQDQARYRGNCTKFNYASVAVVPIHCRKGILGAIHLADRRVGQFPPALVEVVESLTPMIGEAVRRFQAEAELAKHRDHLEELVKQRTSELEAANEQLRKEIASRVVAEEALLRDGGRAQALEPGPGAVWLRGLARPAGTAAGGGGFRAAAGTSLPGESWMPRRASTSPAPPRAPPVWSI